MKYIKLLQYDYELQEVIAIKIKLNFRFASQLQITASKEYQNSTNINNIIESYF